MWNYYGSKSIIVDHYPPPRHQKIIECFAGSARYALKYWDREVLLVDKYDVIIKIWKYLQQCSVGDILGLPKLTTGLDLRTLNLSEEERLFLGMMAGVASTSPRNKVSMFTGEQNGRFNKFKRIAANIHKIKHWTIEHGCYKDIPNQVATWFIDPPYQNGGHGYVERDIDYLHLSEWVRLRMGQAIVCENMKATWLPFKPLQRMRGANMKHTVEAIWSNLPTAFDYEQTILFK